MSEMLYLNVFPVLLVNSIRDVIKKRIFLWLTLFWGAFGLGIRIYEGYHFNGGFLVGVIMLLIGFLSHGRIGYGDGIIIIALSMYLSFWEIAEILTLASIGAALFSLILLIFFHKTKNYEIPFVPFIFISTVIVSVMEAL